MEPAPAPPAPLRVFCSYARPDEPLLDELRKHLAPLRRVGMVEIWHDRLISPGSEHKEEVDQRLDDADLILLLISPDFAASDYCYGVEAARALARHDRGEAMVIPIMLRPVDIELLPISRLQPLPGDLRPVTAWPDRDAAWLDVERGIRQAIEIVTRRRGARPPSAPPPAPARPVARPFCVPPIANRFYPIREDVLADLRARFVGDPGAPFPRVQCICGFGGVGKTHTALHYASRYRHHYSGVFLVRASSEISLRQGFFDVARAVSTAPPHGDPLDLDAAVREATAWLVQNPVWLLILDHVDDPELAARFLPDGAQGHVLVTSQKGDVQALGVVRPIYIGGLSAADAMSFLRARTGRALDDPAEREAAEKLAEELGRVPIALEQAAAYISTMSIPFAVHLRTLRSHPREVLAKYKAVFGEHRESFAGIWDISLAKIEREAPASLQLLYLSAFLHGERIPLSLFCRDDHVLTEVVAELGPTLAEALRDLESIYEILQPLSAYSLIFRAPGADWYGVNSMLQKAVRIRMGAEAEALWFERVVRAVERAIRPLEDRDWPLHRRLIPQIKAVIDLVVERGLTLPEAGRVLERGAMYAHEQARYSQAEELYQRALAIFRAQPSPDELDLAQGLNGLGRIRFRQGRYHEAEAYFVEALSLRKKRLAPTHPDIATSLNNLALLHFSSGSHAAEVDAMLREALSLRECALGPRHPLVAKTLNNLGLVRGAAGDHDAAEELHRRALSIRRELLGVDHPDVAQSLNGLGGALAGKGLYREAEESYRAALAIAERALGPDHPDLAFSHSGLGRLRSLEGKDDEALPCHGAALTLRERALGPDHPYVARSLRELALIHDRRGHPREAEPLYRRALLIWSASLDPSHPDRLACEVRLAALLHPAEGPLSRGSPLP
jgi:tetratricopeptide (TPR) repeat protein